MPDRRPYPTRQSTPFRDADLPGSEILVGRRTLIGAALLALVLVAWGGAVTYYILFRDEVAQRFFAQQTMLKITYEDRIGDLSARLAREVTQNMVDGRELESRTGALAKQQAEIEARQARLQLLAEQLGGGAAAAAPLAAGAPSVPLSGSKPAVLGSAKPAPIFDPGPLRTRDDEPASHGKRDRVSALEERVAATSRAQIATAKLLGRRARVRSTALRNAVEATGLDLDRLLRSETADATGGPLVPWTGEKPADAFALLTAAVESELSESRALGTLARRMPLGRPIAGLLDETSAFGPRVDPFTRAVALHTGMDLRIENGGPVRATGSGRVTVAEYTGGYGNLVEVDHGNGVVTRYGHLSAFAVSPGDLVAAGQLIGRAGSTGRSTGSHLHYETRINGEPVNPARFLGAGQLLLATDG